MTAVLCVVMQATRPSLSSGFQIRAPSTPSQTRLWSLMKPPPISDADKISDKSRSQSESDLKKTDRDRQLSEYDEKLQQAWDEEWADTSKRTGIDWLFERYRRNIVGQSRYPKTVKEFGGLPLFGKEGIPEKFGGVGFWQRNFVSLPARSKYSDVGTPGSKTGGIDTFRILFNNLLQFVLGNESEDGAPVAAWDPVESFQKAGPFKFFYFLATGNLQVGGVVHGMVAVKV